MQLLEVKKIWDKAKHNALTDLIFYKNRWFCSFREGDAHVSLNGDIRILSSLDGNKWQSVALLSLEVGELRDPKFSVTSKGELMLNTIVNFKEPKDNYYNQSITFFSSDGIHWSKPFTCPTGFNTWRWSITWYKGTAYSFGYSGKDVQGCLYSSEDGKSWKILKDMVYPDLESFGNETSILFLDDKAYCLLRRDKQSCTAMLGISKPPYIKWSWNDLNVQIGGPKMIMLPDGRIVAVVRLCDKRVRTSLCLVDIENFELKEELEFPSGGDCSYAGVVYKDGLLWISYYSSHEDKTVVYFAKVKV